MKKLIFLFLLQIIWVNVKAQSITDLNNFHSNINPEEVKSLFFEIENYSFYHNTEYMGDIVNGYTWTGAWLRPKLRYTFSENLNMKFGGHFLRYHSRDEYTFARPWLSVQFRMSDKMTAIFGNLNQNKDFGLVKQLWEPERIMIDPPREGIQFFYKTDFIELQNWISWEQFILTGDPFQEHFTFGLSSSGQLFSNSVSTVKIPLQLLVYHKGGEIDSSPLEVITHYNYATGLETNFKIGENLIRNIDLNLHWLGYQVPDGPAPYNYDNGHAYSISLAADTKLGKFSLDYWNAYQFIAPYGKKIYMSASDRDLNNLSQQDRSQLSFNFIHKQKILKDMEFAFVGETFYDLITTRFSFGFGYHLVINQDFFLKRF